MRSLYPIKSLGDVLILQYGKPLPESARTSEGGVPAYGANGVLCQSRQAFRTKPSIIVGRKGSAGEINLTEGPFWPTDVTYFVEHDERESDLRYLFYALKLLNLQKLAKGVKPGVNRNEVYALKIPMPSLHEQKRIVVILDEAFEGIDTATANAKKNLANARELFTRCRDLIFSGRGEGWVTDSLAECLQFITYGFTNPMPSTDSGPYMVTAKNVVGGRIDYTNSRHTSPEAFQNLLSEKSRPKIGDLLLTKDGTLGRLAVVDVAGICVNQSVAVLRPNGRMSVAFMRHLLEAESYQKRMIDDAGGTTIKHIYITRVDKMPVVYPRNPNEQQRIVAQLDEIAFKTDQLKSLYQKKLESLSYLKRSLLQRAFAGNLSNRSIAPAQEAAE